MSGETRHFPSAQRGFYDRDGEFTVRYDSGLYMKRLLADLKAFINLLAPELFFF